MRDAMYAAESANQAKTQFLSNMSHDIRTPMNAVVNMTRFALEFPETIPERGEFLHTILQSSEHLLHLINVLLDVSRIETGKATISNEAFDMDSCLNEVTDIIKPLSVKRAQNFISTQNTSEI